MPLSARQERAYFDLCDLWEPSFAVAASSLPADVTYSLAAISVACRFVVKAGVDALQTVGLVESDDLITVDTIRLPEGQDVESSWIVVNKSLLDDGTAGPYYGKAWMVRGEPRRRSSRSGRPAGRVVCYATKLPDNALPAGIG